MGILREGLRPDRPAPKPYRRDALSPAQEVAARDRSDRAQLIEKYSIPLVALAVESEIDGLAFETCPLDWRQVKASAIEAALSSFEDGDLPKFSLVFGSILKTNATVGLSDGRTVPILAFVYESRSDELLAGLAVMLGPNEAEILNLTSGLE